MGVSCNKCGYSEDEKNIEEHHVIPKSIGGTDLDGRLWLCKSCHSRLGTELPKQLWKFIRDEDKEKCKATIKSYTKWFIERNDS